MSSLRQALCSATLCLSALLGAGLAQATTLYSNSISISSADPTQLGRLSRNGTPQDWSGGEAFPGVINTGTSYHYTTLTLDLDGLIAGLGLGYGGYLQISFDSVAPNTFLSAYLDSYSAADKALNWLGDAGASGNFFGTDPRFFQVFVQTGHDLVLLLNETASNGGLNAPGGLLVEAFQDTEYTDLSPSAAVPEPAMLGLVLLAAAGALAARRVRPVFDKAKVH